MWGLMAIELRLLKIIGNFSSWIQVVPRGVAPDEHSNGSSESLIVCLGSEVHLRSVDNSRNAG